MSEISKETLNAIQQSVEAAFAAGVDDKRFIDISRIPLICQSIVRIDKNIGELKDIVVSQDEFWPVKTVTYGIVGLILTGVVGALLALVVKG